MIELKGLSKRFGSVVAVEDITTTVRAGAVTGFLGPNGAGKTTTLRMLLGLVEPTSGSATIMGRRYRELRQPLGTVGAMLEASGFHPARTARDHLRWLCVAGGLPVQRAEAAIEQVDLGADARRPVGGFSLGMRQRLGLAAALLGDPAVVVLDEPANGLDPQGIRWLRGYLRELGDRGKTVFVSSHVLAEVEQVADDVVIVAGGRVVKAGALTELRREFEATIVRTPDVARLAEGLRRSGYQIRAADQSELAVLASCESVGHVAADIGVELHLLQPSGGLEEAFLELTSTGADP